VKAKIVELIQVWSHAFRNEPSYKVVQETFTAMKAEGSSSNRLDLLVPCRLTEVHNVFGQGWAAVYYF